MATSKTKSSTTKSRSSKAADTPRRKREVVSAFITEEHEVLGGKGKVIRTKASGQVYQLRMWIPAESKYWRKTLNTTDLETAIKRGEEEVFRIHGEIHSGKKIFGITLGQLIGLYLDWRLKEDVGAGNNRRRR